MIFLFLWQHVVSSGNLLWGGIDSTVITEKPQKSKKWEDKVKPNGKCYTQKDKKSVQTISTMRGQKCPQDLYSQSCLSFQALLQKTSVQLSPWSQRRNFSSMICLSLLLLPINSSFVFILHAEAGLRVPKYHHSNAGFLCFNLRFQSLLFLLLLSTLT